MKLNLPYQSKFHLRLKRSNTFHRVSILGSIMLAFLPSVSLNQQPIFGPKYTLGWPLPQSQAHETSTEHLSRNEILFDLLHNPAKDRDIHVEDFLWSGSGDGEIPDYDYITAAGSAGDGPDLLDERLSVQVVPTTYTVTQVHTVYATVPSSLFLGGGGPADTGHAVDDHLLNEDPLDGLGPHYSRYPDWVRPTPVLNVDGGHPTQAVDGAEPNRTQALPNGEWRRGAILPRDEFLVRTVLHSNMTIIHNKIEHFKDIMERKLTNAYRRAYVEGLRKKRLAIMPAASMINSTNITETTANATVPPEGASTETTPKPPTLSRVSRAAPSSTNDTDDDALEDHNTNTTTSTTNVEDGSTEAMATTTVDPFLFLMNNDTDDRLETKRVQRQQDQPKVTIHNIISGLPKPEIEMLYSVYKDQRPIPAKEAVAVLDNVGADDVETMLGFPLVTKAEPYVPRAEKYTGTSSVPTSGSSHTSLLIAAVIISAFLVVLVLIVLLFLIKRAKKNGGISVGHRKLMASPTSGVSGPTVANLGSRNASHAEIQTSIGSSQDDKAGYLLDRPVSRRSGGAASTSEGGRPSSKLSSRLSRASSALDDLGAGVVAEGRGGLDSADDLKSDSDLEGQAGQASAKRGPASKRQPRGGRHQTGKRGTNRGDPSPSPSAFSSPSAGGAGTDKVSQHSAFPAPTPDRMGPLSDLLEEEIVLPGESRDTSANIKGRGRRAEPATAAGQGAATGGGGGRSSKKGANWAYLPPPRSPTTSTTSSDTCSRDEGIRTLPSWKAEVEKTRQIANQYRKVLSDTFRSSSSGGEDEDDDGVVVHHEGEVSGDGEGQSSLAAAASTGLGGLKKRAVSAKSHIFRKGKVESRLPSGLSRGNKTRPLSAHETRHANESLFHMRQRHWEGLIAGKKTLHRGQLLPGSSTSDEEQQQQHPRAQNQRLGGKPPPTCWSECSSPRKQVRISVAMAEEILLASDRSDGNDGVLPRDPEAAGNGNSPYRTADTSTTPIIAAIKEELQRFHRPRSPNLSGISIINDPELLHKDQGDPES